MKPSHLLIRYILASLLLTLPLSVQALNVAVGDKAPAVELPNLPADGATTSLSSLRGKVVYLDFWASWCGPCRLSLPMMNTVRNELKDRGFEVLAINVDAFEEDALEFLKELPVDYPVLSDVDSTSPSTYGVLGMPTAFLIDRDGVIVAIHEGFRRGDAEKIRDQVEAMLDQ
ncbi:TlpA family protein disulfide reductase [Halieaceae bacterium IMCC14734]|uniref:TlpA family protein disulfide reductase n=1 Tax=Candidatus Litorirhabdus singularis TaxID=2518993 RepID=A0ABT3TPD0_9GAMM|nr:TlpA disulfide reductase family protein [Candidatus Litorirhabdus singularis]MCX2983264.1 TlpA family protein disulfide reductase [Candidatus Litorirhabdus singularis]